MKQLTDSQLWLDLFWPALLTLCLGAACYIVYRLRNDKANEYTIGQKLLIVGSTITLICLIAFHGINWNYFFAGNGIGAALVYLLRRLFKVLQEKTRPLLWAVVGVAGSTPTIWSELYRANIDWWPLIAALFAGAFVHHSQQVSNKLDEHYDECRAKPVRLLPANPDAADHSPESGVEAPAQETRCTHKKELIKRSTLALIVATLVSFAVKNAVDLWPPELQKSVTPSATKTGYQAAQTRYDNMNAAQRQALQTENYNQSGGPVIIVYPEQGRTDMFDRPADPGVQRPPMYQSNIVVDICSRIARNARKRQITVDWPMETAQGEMDILAPQYWDASHPPSPYTDLRFHIDKPLDNAATPEEKIISLVTQFASGYVATNGAANVYLVEVSFPTPNTTSGGVKIHYYPGPEPPALASLKASLGGVAEPQSFRVLEPRFYPQGLCPENRFLIEYGNLNFDKDYYDIQNPINRERLARQTVDGLIPPGAPR